MYACMGQIDLSTLVNDTSQVSVMYEGMRQIDLDKRYQVSVTFVQFTKVRTNKVRYETDKPSTLVNERTIPGDCYILGVKVV